MQWYILGGISEIFINYYKI